jgi:3-phenylpropionate/cinnamic acid dioxygenase small subunit
MSLSSEDRQQLNDLMMRYARAVDIDGTEEEFLAMFTEDAVIDGPAAHHEGTQGVKDFARRVIERRKLRQGRHVVTNLLIEGAGDHASVRAYLVVYMTETTPIPPKNSRTSELLYVGVYECIARRVDGAWRLKQRIVKVDAPR